jgi:hypothetical protein
MRRFSLTIPFLVTGVCFYFAVVFGREAIAVLTSPSGGLENPVFARAVYGIGLLAGLETKGLLRLAAFLATLKLATAVLFALHLLDRFNPLRTAEINHELLDTAALLCVCVTAVLASPALLEVAPQLLAPHRPALWLAGLAATLSMIERAAQEETPQPVRVTSRCALPPRRMNVSARRWDYLRREAKGL